MTPPQIGHMNVFSAIRPRLSAGIHDVRLSQAIDQGGAIPDVTKHVDVVAPRFKLPPNEILSVFPPPNAVGAFESRLPQIALKQRTLPWARESDGSPIDRRPPWLALVVLADGEANFRSNVAIADALPADVRARLGVTETGTCDVLEVSRTVVDKVFPAKEELPLLTHVREVNLLDSEFAGTDDDGFVAVVISNRLPQPATRYGAYLISLEGRYDELPDTPGFQDDVGPRHVFDLSQAVLEQSSFARNPGLQMQLGATADAAPATARPPTSPVLSPWSSAFAADVVRETSRPGAATASFAGSFVFDAVDFALVEGAAAVALERFPVLAHWSFECDAGGDFQSLMQHLDVGLLGTVVEPPAEPGAAVPPPPEVADTGHTVIDHVTRRGEATRAWYRGAFVPREVQRRAAGSPYHSADQARRIAEDGREDLSEAAAFEIGRMLALAEPRFVAALQEWRRGGFTVRRAKGLLDAVPGLRDLGLDAKALSRTLNLALLADVAASDAIGPRVPLDDVGPLLRDDDAEVIAAGLDLDRGLVEEVLSAKVTQQAIDGALLEPRLATTLDEVMSDGGALEALVAATQARAARIAREAGEEER